VAARRLLGLVGNLLQSPAAQRVHAPLLAVHERHESALTTTHERHERRKQEVVCHADRVGNGRGQRHRAPDVVEARHEDRVAVRAVAVELGLEEALETLEIVSQTQPYLVSEVAARGTVRLRAVVEERAHPRRHVGGRRGYAGIEIQVQADRAAVLRTEARELPQSVQAHSGRHRSLSAGFAMMLCVLSGARVRNTWERRCVL
jgi:hypothetical protein